MTLCFQFVFAAASASVRRNDFRFSRQNCLSWILYVWNKDIIGLGKCTGWPFFDLDPRRWLWRWWTKIGCLRDKVRTTQPSTTKLCGYILLVMLITWLDFERIMLETLFCQIGPIDVKQKGCASVGYWVNYVTSTFDPTHDLDLVVLRSTFEIAFFAEWEGWLTWNIRDVSRSFMTMTVTCG